ncbi:MAG TPA: hypothetical protein P5119_10705 [Candidatus Aminicenantes bacterium]|nr:hypothetical protein [Candidatus Aminicenantes bacterium]HRY65795.1 hypothetical protein [Candidatus Aminicenantes bacterium]HRZ72709.1 hypothetical protein [Candidatus Aminicenantes bacterium]
MTRKSSCLLAILAILATAASAVPALPKDKDEAGAIDSAWASAPLKIDGLGQDWQGVPFLSDKGSKAEYALRNDGRNLYVIFLFKTPEAASTIEATGLKVFFCVEGRKSKDRGVHFLKKRLTADALIGQLEKQGEALTDARKAEIRQKKEYEMFEAEVINKKKAPASIDPAVATDPPAFGARSRTGETIYEFRVPLSRTNQPGGLGAEPGQTLKLGFDWGGLTSEMKRAIMGLGGGRPAAAPSLSGSVSAERDDQAREFGAVLSHDPAMRQHAFWIDVRLAAAPAK